MEEKRRSPRSGLQAKLVIKRLDSTESAVEVTIYVTDVSAGGVGFSCHEDLAVGSVYEVYLEIWTKEVIHTFLEIVRVSKKGDTYYYGSSFVGLPELEVQRITTYQTIESFNKK